MKQPDQIVSALAALAQQHRLAVFRMLVEAGPDGLAAGVIATRLDLAPSSLSFHLAQLERAGLVSTVRAGRSILYSADFAAMTALVSYLTENCCGGSTCETPATPVPPERNAA
ncbi:ArsR/SmtB family transcription factor [Sphingomonas sp. MMS24-J45]|uniref:ArsR/SmtB family transcription factor n=1 Tax=Sphingomonas sp. MMS24-J45 TaxID=3238806 RepID=UPI00384D5171